MTPRAMRQFTAGILLTAVVAISSIVFPAPSWAQSVVPKKMVQEAKFREGEVLVKFKKSVSDSAGDAFATQKRLRRKDRFVRQNLSLFEFESGESTEAMIAALQHDPRVEYVEPNYIRTIQATPNDPHMKNLWGMQKMALPEAWNKTTGNTDVIVAVLDTGVLYQHADLAPNMWNGSTSSGGCNNEHGAPISGGCPHHGWDYVHDDNDPMDDHGHGSHISSTLGARGNNGTGVAGVNWNVSIMAVKIAGSGGSLTSSDWIRGLNFARHNGAQVVNASFAGFSASNAEREAIADFPGLVIAASGNGGSDKVGDSNDADPTYPASYRLPNLISVAATDQHDTLATFSNYGAANVDVAAPGVSILGASSVENTTSYYSWMSGTSMAAPHVAGLAALLWAYKPTLTPAQLRTTILQSGDSFPMLAGKTVTGRRVNATKALAYVDTHHASSSTPVTSPVQPPVSIIPPIVAIGETDTNFTNTISYPNGSILRLVGTDRYFFIVNGKRKLVPYPTYATKYHAAPYTLVSAATIRKFPIYRA